MTSDIHRLVVRRSAGSDPGSVRWLEWGAEAFDRADQEQRPILLSIAARWSAACLEMDGSTYLDPTVCRIIADRFVPVRVDSDRRPDLNERYNLGGWPSTVFLTPAGEILCGGTYFASGTLCLALEQVADAFESRRREISARRDVHAVVGRPVSSEEPPRSDQAIDYDAELRVVEWLMGQVDDVYGGFGTAPKYPHLSSVRFLLHRYQDQPDPALNRTLLHMLDAMCEGSLYDHDAGGFFRYANAQDWSEPQKEKLLSDQAAWLELLLDAAALLDRESYRVKAESLVKWVLSSFAHPDGGFFGSVRGVQDPHEATGDPYAPEPIDRTIFVDENADMAAGLLRAADMLGDQSLTELALASLERVLLMTYRPGVGVAHYHDGTASVRGLLADQLHASRALIIAADATGQVPHLMLAEELVSYAVRTMWDEERGGFLDRAASQDGSEDERGLLKHRFTPFGDNCLASRVLVGLGHLTDKPEYERRALQTLAAVRGASNGVGFAAAEYALAVRDLRMSARS